MTNTFEQASYLKLRFPYRGNCTTEDLWDIPLEALDDLYGTLRRQAKTHTKDSLLRKKSDRDTVLELRVAVIKRIVEARVAEAKALKAQADNATRKQKLLRVLARKQDETLGEMSEKEIKKLIDEL